MPLTLSSSVVATDNQVSTSVGGQVVILGMHDGVYYGLDAVGASVWLLLREPIRVADIVSSVTSEFEVDAATCERDVLALLEDCAARGLVREAEAGA